jgi:hypothetical protein
MVNLREFVGLIGRKEMEYEAARKQLDNHSRNTRSDTNLMQAVDLRG